MSTVAALCFVQGKGQRDPQNLPLFPFSAQWDSSVQIGPAFTQASCPMSQPCYISCRLSKKVPVGFVPNARGGRACIWPTGGTAGRGGMAHKAWLSPASYDLMRALKASGHSVKPPDSARPGPQRSAQSGGHEFWGELHRAEENNEDSSKFLRGHVTSRV